MVFGKELSGQISFAAAEFYAKDFLKAGHRQKCRCPAFSWHRFWVLRFYSTAFCRCHFYFYGFLTDANLSAFLILYFTHRSFADLVLCHGGFQGPPDMGRFQRSRWTSDGHFFRTDLYGWTAGKTSCLDTPDGGRKYPCRSRRRRWGLTNFSQHYIIFIASKSHIIWLAKRK